MVFRNSLPAQDVLLRLLRYDPDTGLLYWRPRSPSDFRSDDPASAALGWNFKFSDRVIGSLRRRKRGAYTKFCLLGGKVLAHRVIWKMIHGSEPVCIDHQNGDCSDNRLVNLRAATLVENRRNCRLPLNNTSGCIGVALKSQGRWGAKIHAGGETVHLGYFTSFEGAAKARKAAEAIAGYHPNHGRASTPPDKPLGLFD